VTLLAAAGGNAEGFYGATSVLPVLLMLAALPMALLAAARIPAPLLRMADRLAATPGRSLAVGASAALVTLVLLAGSGSSPLVAVPALLALAAISVLSILGLVAEARRLGAEVRGREPVAGAVEGGSATVGWLLLAGLPLLPVAGPLVLLYLTLRAAGAAILALSGR
jgi:hypothetical protein